MMKSPIGKRLRLKLETLDSGLVVHECPESGGIWITALNYDRWLSRDTELPAAGDLPFDLPAPSSEHDGLPKLCPETETIMVRYRVAAGKSFYLDRSITGGVWLDAGEWQILQHHGVSKMLGVVFTGSWQARLREISVEKTYHASLEAHCGEEVLKLVNKLDELLESDTARSMAVALLSRPANVEPTHTAKP